MLEIWILNVGKGDSAVIKYSKPEGEAFAVIDSNMRAEDIEPRALLKL